MSTFECVKTMTRQDVRDKVESACIREYGTYNDYLSKKWMAALKEHEGNLPIKVVAALNNNDTSKKLLELLKSCPDKVFEGIAITAYALDTTDMELYLPEGNEELAKELSDQAKEFGIHIVVSFVNIRNMQDCVIHHLETMVALSKLFGDGNTKERYIAVKRANELGELQKIAFGTKIGELIKENQDTIKAIEIGTKLYDSAALEMVIDDSLVINNGIITIIDNNQCLIQEAEKRTYESLLQGCGKCTFCREGLIQLNTMLKEITEGQGKNEFIAMLEEIGNAMTFSTLCSVGQTGADFVLGSLKSFVNEYTDHIKKRNCPANVCTSFQSIYIDPKECVGCEDCTDVCPLDCIEGKAGFIHMIDEFDCTQCGKCIEVCESNAIIRTTGRVPKLPTKLTKCGKFK